MYTTHFRNLFHGRLGPLHKRLLDPAGQLPVILNAGAKSKSQVGCSWSETQDRTRSKIFSNKISGHGLVTIQSWSSSLTTVVKVKGYGIALGQLVRISNKDRHYLSLVIVACIAWIFDINRKYSRPEHRKCTPVKSGQEPGTNLQNGEGFVSEF